jgi:hypothetical protein
MGTFRARKPTESEIEIQVCHFLHYKKIFFWKAVSTGYFDSAKKKFVKQYNPWALNGIPDLCLVIDGKFYGWELKSEKGEQSEGQKIFENRLTKEGKAPYKIIRSLQDAERELVNIFLRKSAEARDTSKP